MACPSLTLLVNAAANGYFGLSDRDLKIAMLELLCEGGASGGMATGTANPNTLGLASNILQYIQTDAATGVLVAVWYRNPITVLFE